jgi:hypothetical protein
MNNSQVYVAPRAHGGCDTYRNINLGATGVLIKGGAGTVFGWYLANNAASSRFVKFYNKLTAPTVGTDTPLLTIALPASSAANVYFGPGIAFSLGIGIGAVQLVADSDTTAPAANDVVVNVFYR